MFWYPINVRWRVVLWYALRVSTTKLDCARDCPVPHRVSLFRDLSWKYVSIYRDRSTRAACDARFLCGGIPAPAYMQ
ncbi:hypothetical protein BUPH_08364 (plasmid) [Paraburkholderia phenoliruptrix BR3459a]|uniref:Uncharacterized protein n=1 Tax=Paraburkholderia phenoliruptrix BR3459a TaxID=1229205 RepID=K0DVL3_9BURK|nr:hypothetical protein BUPH_08364 [Paraburkholderia phenoliruptrix BR3459a]